MLKKIPTERQVLRCIFEMYEATMAQAPGSGRIGAMVAIDVEAIARKLNCNKDVMFGYLYFHLDHKYRYCTGPNSNVQLFAQNAGTLHHAINLPYLAAILAGQDQEQSKSIWSLGLSLAALALSVAAIIAQLVAAK